MACLFKRRQKYWISYYHQGKQVKRSLKTSDARIARAEKKRIEYEISLGDLHVASELRLEAVLETFCRHLMATQTFKSYKNELSRLRTFFGPICQPLKLGGSLATDGDKPGRLWTDKYAGSHVTAEFLEDVTPEAINHFISDRIEANRWSPKSANLLRQILHRLFAYAIRHHGFRSRDRRYPNPVTCVDRLREPAPVIRFLSLAQIAEQLDILQGNSTIHALVATYIYAGLRREEALWLTKEDVDLGRRLMKVQAKTVEGEFWQPKTKVNRVVPISNALCQILCNYKSLQDSVWFFPSPGGKKWDPDNFSQDLRVINKASGLDWSCLDFRHTFGSQLAMKGESLYKISKLMGNSPEICRKHYAALIPEEMADVVEFSAKGIDAAADTPTRELLEQVLHELKGQRAPAVAKPQLRLVHLDNSA